MDYTTLHRLTHPQAAAARALIAGATHDEAAQIAGVHRVTVTRWANHHPAFRAEVNRARADIARRTQATAARLTDLALGVVESALQSGDLDTALKWLRVAPLLPPAVSSGPVEPEDVIEEARTLMPSPLDELCSLGDTCTTEDAERAIAARLDRLELGARLD